MKKALILSLLVAACSTGEHADVAEVEQPVALATAALKPTVWHSVQQGQNASAYFGDETGSGYLDVWESRLGNQSGASLWYSIYRQDPTSQVCVDECFCFPGPLDGGVGGMGGAAGGPFPGGGPAPGDPDACPPECFPVSYCYYTRYSWEDGYGDIPSADFRASPRVAVLDTSVTLGEDFFVTRCSYDEEAPDPYTCEDLEGSFDIGVRFVGDGRYSDFYSGTSRSTYGSSTYQSHGNYRSASAQAEGNIGDVAFAGEGSIGSSHNSQVSRDIYEEEPPDGGLPPPPPLP